MSEEKKIGLEFINNEIEDLKKQLAEKQGQAKSLQAQLTQVSADIHAIDGALQQCDKFKYSLEGAKVLSENQAK
jgi:septal ring factor EnvC (AmiA/AmiB activator)